MNSVHEKLQELVSLVEDSVRRGEPVSLAHLCKDCPELMEQLAQRINLASSAVGSTSFSQSPGDTDDAITPPPPRFAQWQLGNGEPLPAGRYRPRSFHARGGLGEVFLATDVELQRDVALKRMNERQSRNRENARRFEFEARVTGRLEHPGVVPIYGFGLDAAGHPVYAMRFIRGESFDETIHRAHQPERPGNGGQQKLSLQQLLRRFLSVCQTVAYAHSRSVVHRDIKPSNVMLGDFGETLLVDWGLAKFTESSFAAASDDVIDDPVLPESPDDTRAGVVKGSIAYMSPEQADGRSDLVGPRSDIYSLGATLYHLLTGRTPFDGSTKDVLDKVRRGEFASPRQCNAIVPQALEAICLKAMRRQPADRYVSALDLAADIERWLADEPVSAYRDPVSVRIARWVRRHRTGVVATAAAALVMLASLGVGVTVLSAKNRDLTAALDRENTAKSQAENRFLLALDAIETFYTGASEDMLLKEKSHQELRDRLLASPLAFCRRLSDELAESDRPVERAALARAYTGIANITRKVGSSDEAAEAFAKALPILQRLEREQPDLFACKYQLALCYLSSGAMQSALGKMDDARDSYQRALETSERLGAQFPDRSEGPNFLVQSYVGLGDIELSAQRLPQAAPFFEKAVELGEALVRQSPGVAAFQDELIHAYTQLGKLKAGAGQFAEAEQYYRKAITGGEELVQQPATSDLNRITLATSYKDLAKLQSAMKHADESLASYEKASAIEKQLVDDRPNVNGYQSELAASYMSIGEVRISLGQKDAAKTAIENAIATSERLVRANPNVSDYKNTLAGSYSSLGYIQKSSDQPVAAVASYERAIELCEQLIEQDPGVASYEGNLAFAYNRLGLAHKESGNRPAAVAAFEKGIAILRRFVAVHPEVTKNSLMLGGLYCNVGNVLRDDHDFERSLDWYAQAIETLSGVLQVNPQDGNARSFLLNSHTGRIEALKDLNRWADATPDADRAVELSGPNERAQQRMTRAWLRAKAQDYAQAASEVDELLGAANIATVRLYHGARVLALASAAAAQDDMLSETDRRETADRLAARAVQVLDRFRMANGFSSPEHFAQLNTEPDLASLRSRDDFQQLLMRQ